MSATPSNTPQDLTELQNAVGEHNGNAIAKFVDGRITAAFDANRAELAELIERVKTMAAASPGDPVVQEAAKVVSVAAKGHNALAGDVTEYPSDEQVAKVAEDADRVQKAAKVVDQAETDLAARVSAAEERLGGHDTEIGSLRSRVGDLEESHSSLQTAVARAIAIASSGEGGALVRASRIALTAFGVVGVLYALIWGLTPSIEYIWQHNLGLALGAGGLAGWVTLIWWGSNHSQLSAAASAEATNGHDQRPNHDAGVDIVRPVQNGGAAASAAAHQGGGQSTGGASASSTR